MHHAQNMGARILPSFLHELLEPTLGALTLLDHSERLGTGLVLWQLGAYELKHWGNVAHDLDAHTFPGVPLLDQLFEMFLGVYL